MLPAQGTIVADSLFTPALGVVKRFTVYLPAGYAADSSRSYPAVYYLHGVWGNETNWSRLGALGATADSLLAEGHPPAILIMPDGDDSFYRTWARPLPADSCLTVQVRPPAAAEAPETYCVADQRYDSYIASDLVTYVDRHYRTLARPAHRAVAGLSMGGYGAVTLAVRFPEVFSAAASHSGTLSLMLRVPGTVAESPRYATDLAQLRVGTGPLWPLLSHVFGDSLGGWQDGDPARLVAERVRAGARLPALFLDVGQDDPFANQTLAFRTELEALGVPHHFARHPGGHDWAYWRRHAAESLSWLLDRVQAR